MILDVTPGRRRIEYRAPVDAARLAAHDARATDAELLAEQDVIAAIRAQLHQRDQQIVAILTARGEARREAR